MMIIDFDFAHEERVCHVLDSEKDGIVIARLDTGGSHLYLVSWGREAPTWHIAAELKKAPDDHD
jgi:hypothetical protein